MVKTPPSHGGNRGSTPLQAISYIDYFKEWAFAGPLFSFKETEVVPLKKRDDIENKTEELVLPFCEDYGFELVDIDFVKEGSDHYLRIYIDKPGGITIDDCETLSRAFNEILDRHEYIEIPYIFEVSSPGLTRQLKKEKDYYRNTGKTVDVRLYKKTQDLKDFTAVLQSYSDGLFTFEVTDDKSGDSMEIQIEKSQIADIRLAFCG